MSEAQSSSSHQKARNQNEETQNQDLENQNGNDFENHLDRENPKNLSTAVETTKSMV